MKTNKRGKALRIIGITAAALTACGGAVFLFLKKKRYFTAFMIAAVILCAGSLTAYATEIPGTEPDGIIEETEYDYTTEPDEIIIGDVLEVDISETYDPEQPPKLTPPGNLTLVDDLSGEQSESKQFITVITKSGNYFYIIIDRAGDKENVYFLNLVDEYDLLAIMADEKTVNPPTPITQTNPTTPGQLTEPTPDPVPTEPKNNNNMSMLIMLLVIAAVGGGAFYYFKVLKPKQGGAKKNAGVSELDEFNFDADEDDFIGADTTKQDGGDYEGDTDMDEDMPDFTAADDNESEDI
jgi:hypothetical protein